MISQDFQLACAGFPEDDEEFMEQMRLEIPKAIRMLAQPHLSGVVGGR